MEVAPEPVDAARRRTHLWLGFAGTAWSQRVPLPIRAKQLLGSLAVAALLALVAVLGLVALGQSNSRGTELRRLQQQGGYEQLLLTDATQLKQLLDFRLGPGSPTRGHRDQTNRPPAFRSRSYQRGFLSALDQQIGNEFDPALPRRGRGSWRLRQCRIDYFRQLDPAASAAHPPRRRAVAVRKFEASRTLGDACSRWSHRIGPRHHALLGHRRLRISTGSLSIRSTSVPTGGRLRSRRSSPSSPRRPRPARTRSSRPTGARTAARGIS